MPLFDYRCSRCGTVTEVFLRNREAPAQCGACGSNETVRLISAFTVKVARAAKYTAEFRERTLPFLKSQPGGGGYFASGGESEEAKAYRLTEKIGAKVDAALEQKVFKNLPG